MSNQYREYTSLNLPSIADEILEKWEKENTFKKSIDSRSDNENFVFFEGPPSANGMPGIHHVMGRTIKDIFCRFKTLEGYKVNRKAGWDTHGLPVELGVEKALGITKEDIGTKISVADYNKACKEAVMKYTDVWNNLTEKMGYWVDTDNPYVTYENKYIESVWWLLSQIYQKDLMYKGYTIQPYSPAAGTGLSSHELNQPGCYKDVKDTTVVAQFKTKTNNVLPDGTFLLAWTTTPWTLPSNTALCVGPKIDYVLVNTYNQYTHEPIQLLIAEKLVSKQLNGKYTPVNEELKLADYKAGDKKIPYEIGSKFKGQDLAGIEYEQLLPMNLKYAYDTQFQKRAFKVIADNFVAEDDGTGIVHIAPTFGADDARVAKESNIPSLLVDDGLYSDPKDDRVLIYGVPQVNLQGKFLDNLKIGKGNHVLNLSGKYVKNEYYDDGQAPEKSVDVEIAIHLKETNRAFKVEKYEHSYPHCWRTDKPVLYYPLDSWFIKVTAVKDELVSLNNTINWKPKSTGTGRFGNWLENANDWNLSRSRYWGIPIPIWRSVDGKESICISSAEMLQSEIEKSVKAGLMQENPLKNFDPTDMSDDNYNQFDLHKNYMDDIILVSESGKPLHREADLIDVWFDSGSMPYAQHHYPFENKEKVDKEGLAQADFIAEGVDQTRGWFYTLHAISTMVFNRVAYKNVVSNGLVLDKNGQKMSKRLGNGVDPFECLNQYGPDATRWYMISNAQPWDNLKFDEAGIVEVQRKFFGTLYNTYNGFLAVYANIDGFTYEEADIPLEERPEIDRWVLSRLNNLIKDVHSDFSAYEPTRATRRIQQFVIDELSNWYVRLCRRRFWKGDYTKDKISAYQTLYTCLEKVAIIASPVAPFFMDKLFCDLNSVTRKSEADSVHLDYYPKVNENAIDKDLEYKMELAQRFSSLVLSIRKKEKLKVRQPLSRIMIPALDDKMVSALHEVKDLILSEVNVKELEIITDTEGVFTKKIKPNFKTIGKKYGKQMKPIMAMVNKWNQDDISKVEEQGGWKGEIDGLEIDLNLEDFEISTEDIPGWLVAQDNELTVALDAQLNETLVQEGLARELVNRIQNIRKDSGFDVTDKILIKIKSDEKINDAVKNNLNYICSETLANDVTFVEQKIDNPTTVELDTGLPTEIQVVKVD